MIIWFNDAGVLPAVVVIYSTETVFASAGIDAPVKEYIPHETRTILFQLCKLYFSFIVQILLVFYTRFSPIFLALQLHLFFSLYVLLMISQLIFSLAEIMIVTLQLQ